MDLECSGAFWNIEQFSSSQLVVADTKFSYDLRIMFLPKFSYVKSQSCAGFRNMQHSLASTWSHLISPRSALRQEGLVVALVILWASIGAQGIWFMIWLLVD